jgi:RNA polymerase sigma factor (sigma-70 family)
MSMQTQAVVQAIHSLAWKVDKTTQTDQELLERFGVRGEEEAFAALTARHGTAVKRVCLHVLGHEQDAEDAFQATFFLLAQRANRLKWQPSIQGWLVQVAWRTASSARTLRRRRRLREQQARPALPSGAAEDERLALVRHELSRLPEKYRLPLWLCFWQGKSQSEAAQTLGWSLGELRGRLFRAKSALRGRLKLQGSALAGLAALDSLAHAAVVPRDAVAALAHAACRLAAGEPASRIVSPAVAALMKGAPMFACPFKLAVTISTILVAAIGFTVSRGAAQDNAPAAAHEIRVVAQRAGAENQQASWQDLMKTIDVERDRVGQGIWRMKQGKLVGYPAGHGARLRIPIVPKGNYELRVRWEPKSDDAGAFFILPHGDRMASFDILSAYGSAGLGDLNGVRSDVNETNKKVKVEGGKVYTVTVQVKYDDTQFHMLARIDGEVIVDWEGKRVEVSHEFFAPPRPASVGLAIANQSSTFHSVELRMLSGKLAPWQPSNNMN